MNKEDIPDCTSKNCSEKARMLIQKSWLCGKCVLKWYDWEQEQRNEAMKKFLDESE